MKYSTVIAALVGTSASKDLRKLAEGEGWLPPDCNGSHEKCFTQEDGYWYADETEEWFFKQYDKRSVEGKDDYYEQQNQEGEWKSVELMKTQDKVNGGYWQDTMEGTPEFKPYKKQESEDGMGYNIDMGGEITYVPYDRRETKDGFYVTRLDGTESELYPWPKEEEEDNFDSDKVASEAAEEAKARQDAELAAKIVGVAENGGRKGRKDRKKRKERKGGDDNGDDGDYSINETIKIGDYTFDVKLKNAVTLLASTLAAATFVAIEI